MASIFSLFGEVLIDNTNANKSIDQTTQKAESSGSKIGSAFSTITKSAVAVGSAVVTGAAAVGTAAFKMASDTASAADEVDKMSQKLGMSKQTYQEWDYVLSQAGVEITSMSTGMKTLTNKIDDAKNGSSSALDMFGKLGISIKGLNKMSREEIFDAVIKGMQGMEDSTERAALANDLFGKSGQDLTALFNETAESTEALKNKAHELGMIMSDEIVEAGVKMTDSVDTIKRSAGGLMNTIGGVALPIVQKFLDLVEGKMPQVQALVTRFIPIIGLLFDSALPPLFDLVETIFPVAISLVETLLPLLIQIISSVLPVVIQLIRDILPLFSEIIEAIMPVLIELLETLLPPVMQMIELILPVLTQLLSTLIKAVLPVVIDLIRLVMPILQPILEILFTILEPLTSLLGEILPPLISIFMRFINSALTPLRNTLRLVAEVLNSVFRGAFESIGAVVGNIKNIFCGIIDFVKNVFTGNWRGAWDAVVKIFTNIFDGIKNAFKIPINYIIDGINVFIRGLNKLKIPDWVPGVGGKGINISQLSRLRVGMDYVPYDEFPALLHKGERVLTESENKEYSNRENRQDEEKTVQYVINFGEKAIYIEHLDGENREDIDNFVDLILELLFEKITRKEKSFA